MLTLTIIVAMDLKHGIGIDNRLPWHVPEDLAHFKRTTLGRPVIMGRKTLESIGRTLPGRKNIVLSRQSGFQFAGAEIASSLQEAIHLAGSGEVFIIGGAEIFNEALGIADNLVVTHIHNSYPCDAFFPEIAADAWSESSREACTSASTGVAFDIARYQRCK